MVIYWNTKSWNIHLFLTENGQKVFEKMGPTVQATRRLTAFSEKRGDQGELLEEKIYLLDSPNHVLRLPGREQGEDPYEATGKLR